MATTPGKPIDALIIGAGPVGLLTAYQLAQTGCTVCIIDKDDKSHSTDSGRANVLYARSAELLDQLGLAEDILQQCFVCRESYTYDAQGKRVIPGRVWNFVENVEDTRFGFAVMLRQSFIENALRRRLEEVGVTLCVQTECVGFEVDEGQGLVASVLRDLRSGTEYTMQSLIDLASKYLIGADGGRSFVRRHLDIPFEGDTTQDKWIRIDGKVKTNLPTPRAYASIESPTHGNVLWAPLDRGITRIGYVYTPEQEARHGGNLTEEAVIEEAIAAVKPFELEFESVEYSIGQRVASTYHPHSRILLVGDACHTHSSGAAQGLNTGIHDATNLAWKLSLVLRDLASPSLLNTYNDERRGAAQRLIAFDRRISTLMANKWPAGEEPQPQPGEREKNSGDINSVLAEAFDRAKGFNTGLGIRYAGNLVNRPRARGEGVSGSCAVEPGERAPDVRLLRPGTLERLWLHSITPNRACMYILALVGDPRMSLAGIASFSAYLAQSAFLKAAGEKGVVKTLTLASVGNTSLGTQEALEGQLPFSPVYYDDKRAAHRRYWIDLRYGALVVVRPDGYVGFVAGLNTAGGSAVEGYLDSFLRV
ncbi:FAD binding domain-containing protein [Aspergillus carlsbadensis]|nr:FAD binding domain-containing protein [Aspergillus carlsbadensis]